MLSWGLQILTCHTEQPMDSDFPWLVSIQEPISTNFICYNIHFFIFYFFPTLDVSFKIFPPFCMLFFYTKLLMQDIFYKTWSEILSVMHNLQKYCKWALFGQHNTFLAHTIHLMLMTCDMIFSPFQSAHKRRTWCAGSPIKASTSFWHLGATIQGSLSRIW